MSLGVSAQSVSTDVMVGVAISNANPVLKGTVSYTITVSNSSTTAATNVKVKVTLPVGYVAATGYAASTGGSSYTLATGDWVITSLSANSAATLQITATVIERGVAFLTAEVIASDQLDIDSVPDNGNYLEDDLDNVCFSVPLLLYAGEEYSVSAPAGFSGVQFFKGADLVGGPNVSSSDASIDGSGNLIIKSTGTYSVAASVSGCQATNCCNIQVDPGPLASLGNYAWLDNNGDGQQGIAALEPPVTGVTVQLFQPGNATAMSTTVTDGSGTYVFQNLTPGEYYVVFTAPGGLTYTNANVGSDRTDSDASPTTGQTQTYTLTGGESNITVDAGLVPLSAALGDYVWLDTNTNGIQDSGEPGVPNVMVTLYRNGAAVISTTTSSLGLYSFTGLTPGNYQVAFTAPAGTTFTTPLVGTSRASDSNVSSTTGQLGSTAIVSLSTSEYNATIDAGLVPLKASLGNYVWLDANRNGQQDPGETGVANLTVTLFSKGSAVATQMTSASGTYLFTNLDPGQYSAVFTAPGGYTFTNANTGNDATDNDAGAGGATGVYSLSAGEQNLTVNAGLVPVVVPTASLGDKVFADNNGNGIQDAGDTPLPGVIVTLISNNSVVSTTTTASSGTGVGCYSFTGLIPGVPYSVSFTTPAGYTAALPNVGNDAADSDPIGSITTPITLAAGENNLTVDAGFQLIPTCAGGSATVVAVSTTICEGDIALLTGTVPGGQGTIRWYLTPTGSNGLIAVTTSGQALTLQPSTTTVYYAEVAAATGCPRTPIAIEVTPKPTTPTCPERVTVCNGRTVDLTKYYLSATTATNIFEWHMGLAATSPLVSNVTAVGPGKYHLFERSLNGCYSNPSILTVEGVSCECRNPATIVLGPGRSICEGELVVLMATLGGGATSVNWTSTGSGTFVTAGLSATYTPSVADIASELVTITGTTNDPDGAGVCTTASSNVVVDINERPAAPVGVAGDDELVCQGQSTKLIGFSTQGARINWYGPNNTFLGSTASAGKLTVTPTGTTVYYAEAVSADGCVSTSRSSVTVVVGQCKADLTVAGMLMPSGPYSVSQTVTYVITACNNGPATAESATVNFPLPASVSYVSVTPSVGTYNPAAGSWSIGSMASGTCRNLFVEVVITGTGTISATAVIAGANNDPTKPESDMAVVSFRITQVACTVTPPHITCSMTNICKDDRTTLVADGCLNGRVVWSNGMTGMSISVAPPVTTSYTATCVVGNCSSGASNAILIQVNNPVAPTILASTSSVCVGGVVSLTAIGCEGGTILWSTGAIGSVIATNINARTTITANCRIGSCLSLPAEKVIDLSSDMPKPTITCSTTVACLGERVELTANNCSGTPLWNTGATTTRITVFPTETDNTYYVTCTNGNCRSPQSESYVIRIVKPTVPAVTASSATVCAGSSVTLTASGCPDGTIQWNTLATGNTLVVRPSTNISYFATCKVRECMSEASVPVAIAVVNPTPPSVLRPSKPIVCSGESVTLTAEGCAAGTIVWSTGATGSSIVIMPTETKPYTASCQIGSCRSASSNGELVTVNTSTGAAPAISASKTAVCGNEPISLTATGCSSGTLIWSDNQVGNVITVIPTAQMNEFYAVCRQGSACGTPRSNTIKVQISPLPTPTVVCSESVICPGESVELTIQNCTGTPIWNTGQSTAMITVRPTVTTGYSVTCMSGSCISASSNIYSITVIQPGPPAVVASATLVQPGESVTLTATCPAGTVQWLNGAATTSIVVSITGTQSYQAFCKFRTCLSDGSAPVTIATSGSCQAAAGSLRTDSGTVCAGNSNTVAISAIPNGGLVVPTGYSVLYILTKGTDMVIQDTRTTPNFVAPAEAATFRIHTLVYNPTPGTPDYLDMLVVQKGVTRASELTSLIAGRRICAALDGTGIPLVVKAIAPPSINGPSLTICAGSSLTLTASGCANGVVQWSNNRTGQSIVINPVTEMVWVSATCIMDGCTSRPSASFSVDVLVPQPPIVISNKPTICLGEQTTLEAVGCVGGRFQWETGQTTASITVTPTTTSNTYRVRCVYGGCQSDYSPVSTVNVSGPNAPTVGIQTSGTTTVTSLTSCFGSPVTLMAKGCPAGAYNIWSNGDVGNQITVSPARSMTYAAQCCTSNNCKSALSNILMVTVGSKVAPPTTIDLTNTCPFAVVSLANGVKNSPTTAGGVFEYYTSMTPAVETRVSNPSAVNRTGSYYAFEKTTAGCYSLGSVIHVLITACEGQAVPCNKNPLTADAGRDDKICVAKTYKLSGKATGGDASIQWTTNGTGKFDDPFSANATYLPSQEDVRTGKVTLTMSVRTPNTVCVTATDDMVLTIEGVKDIPTIRAMGPTNLCAGDSVILEASTGESYLWSNRATGNRIVVKTSGTYSVQSFDKAGCSSLKSDEIVVTVGNTLSAPLVSNKRNTCPATTVDLTTALNETAADGTTYAFRIGTSPTAGLVMRPDAVTDGMYYAFRTNGAGCVSAPAAIEVKTFNCATDTIRADLAITKTASKTALNRGEVVTYTITVQNKGAKPVTNVNVRDVLPAGLELIPAQGNFNVSNGAITKWWGVFAANTTETITFQARAVKKGAIVNTAEITYADQQDPVLTNNKSSVTIADTSAARPGMIGLAKVVASQKSLTDSTFQVEYTFRLTNYGDSDLTKVQVTDDLKSVFGTHTIQEIAVATTDADNFKLVFNPAFLTGNPKIFDGNGTLKASATTYFFVSAKVKLDPSNTNRTFSNTAMASAKVGETITEDASVNGSDADPDGDGNPNNNASASVFTLVNKQAPVNPIGVALAAVSSVKQPDNSYNVTFKVMVKNFGEKELTNVSLSDSLVKAFPAPARVTVVSGPTTRANSNLLANTGYNGSTNTNLLLPDSKLAVGEMDSVLITVNIMPNGSNGPFYSSVLATGLIASTSVRVSDQSNNGVDPTPAGDRKTPVRFDLPEALVGVAKSVGTPIRVEEGIFDVPYTIKVSNFGTADLTRVQVVDNLANTFNRGALILSNRIRATADAGMRVDTMYTGQGLLTRMLVDSLSTLPRGTSRSLSFTVRVNVKNADSLTFYNSAVATAQTAGGMMVADTSTAGTNPDPKNNLDPRTSNDPTQVVLNAVPNKSYIGIALMVKDTVLKADGSYDITFQVVVKNYGTVAMTNVTVSDTLSNVFNEQKGASFRVIGIPIASIGSGLKVNAAFNGYSDVRLVVGEGSTLGAGRADTLTFVVNVKSNGLTTTFFNTAYATGIANTIKVTDISTSGLNPDVNGNRNPTDSMEGEATQVILRVTDPVVFIPEGFSPNGDNINDLFVIRGAQNQTIRLEVFNRWGHTVYKSDDYKNDWNGASNTGVRVGNAGGLPDGTYFYRVQLENGRTYVRYMTINR